MVTLSAIEALGIALIKGTIKNFEDFRLLADWLGCYKYVMPADRVVLSELVKVMCNYREYVTTDYSKKEKFNLWNAIFILERNIPLTEQRNMLSWVSL